MELIPWYKRWWRHWLCMRGLHDARGPIEGVAFEITPGMYHPYYQCRRCYRMLKWQIDGGWKADG